MDEMEFTEAESNMNGRLDTFIDLKFSFCTDFTWIICIWFISIDFLMHDANANSNDAKGAISYTGK